MRGISHKDLLEIDPWQYDNYQDLLNHIIEQCKELNPWLPLEEFLRCGFVGLCWVPFAGGVVESGFFDGKEFRHSSTSRNFYLRSRISRVMPIYKPETSK